MKALRARRTSARPLLVLCAAVAASSCVGQPPEAPGVSLAVGPAAGTAQAERERIERLILMGSPASLAQALELAAASERVPRADARAYAWVAYELARMAYPDITPAQAALSEQPGEGPLTKAFIDARNGRGAAEPAQGGPLFEFLPMIGVFRLRTSAVSQAALLAYERFSAAGIPSALAAHARGVALERSGDPRGALASYQAALALAADCYPASLASARLLSDAGRAAEALAALEPLDPLVKAGHAYRRAYAYALYAAGRFEEALPLVTRVLQDDPLDSRFVLFRAHMLIQRGEFRLAGPLLDAYASVDPNDKLYLLLRARASSEGAKDRNAALATARRGVERYPNDAPLLTLAAELLFQGDPRERLEAISLAGRAVKADPRNRQALALLLAADLAGRDGAAAAARADEIRSYYPDYADFESLYRSYAMAGRTDEARAVVQSWRQKDPASEAAALAWARMLVDSGSRAEASAFVNQQLAAKGSPSYRSNLFLLQARLQANDEAALASLRSSLIENGLNVDALLAMTDLYLRRADYQRARFYLRQALSLEPARADLAQRRDALAQQGVAIP